MEIVVGVVCFCFVFGFLVAWCASDGEPLVPESGFAGAAQEELAKAVEDGMAQAVLASQVAEVNQAVEEAKAVQEADVFTPDPKNPHLTVREARIKAQIETARAECAARLVESRVNENTQVVPENARLDETLGLVFEGKPDDADDLTKIKGVATIMNGKLNALGIYRYQQIALWTPILVAEVARRLSFKDRIAREDWTGQCRELHRDKYGEDL